METPNPSVAPREEKKTLVPCLKCQGRGEIAAFSGVAGGVCFSCGGRGGRLVRNNYRPAQKFGCVFAGALLFWVTARSEAEALRKAVAHWSRNRSAPAFLAVNESEISVVTQ